MSEGSFCVVDRFWQRWYYGFVDVIVQINPGLSRWTQRATPDSSLSKGEIHMAFGFFLPELKKTGCRIWGFILPAISEIEGEIDLWTREIEKNFRVVRGESYEDVLGEARRFL